MKSPLLLSLFDETERRPLTVSDLTAQVRGALENRFASVWIEGEISNFKAHASGHWYFTLKDEFAQLRAACFRVANSRIRFRPRDGLLVRAHGRLTVYEPRGSYELIVEALDPVGAGAMQVAFEQLRERLAAEGLFAEELKRPLPLLPRRVAIVTSPSGAALHDIVRVIERRTRTVQILFAPVRVQGEGAASEIANAINLLNQHHARAIADGRAADGVDTIIVGRGGGSTEDLWAFNAEEVARAIRASAIPVISAVGHETDFTIADFAADVRAATPSAAAELVAAREDELVARLEDQTRALVQAMRYEFVRAENRLQEAALSSGFDDTRHRLHEAKASVAQLDRRLHANVARSLQRQARRIETFDRRLVRAEPSNRLAAARLKLLAAQAALDNAAQTLPQAKRSSLAVTVARLNALSPLAVLGRGYSIAQDSKGRAVRAANDVSKNDRVRVRLAKGELLCLVEETRG